MYFVLLIAVKCLVAVLYRRHQHNLFEGFVEAHKVLKTTVEAYLFNRHFIVD